MRGVSFKLLHEQTRLKGMLWLLMLGISWPSLGQTLPLSFTGTPTISGTLDADGSTYTWNNVGSYAGVTIKAVITLLSHSGNPRPVLENIDGTSAGQPEAWQPVINCALTAAGNCWSMAFQISFYNAGTNAPLALPAFNANSIDIDGDGNSLSEVNTFTLPISYTMENPTNVSFTANSSFITYQALNSVYGVDINQTGNAITNHYVNTSTLFVTLGACCGGTVCSAPSGSRLHSIDFYNTVPYHNPKTVSMVLPVVLTSFSGHREKNGCLLKWSTATEDQTDRFMLEKSTDGRLFSPLFITKAKKGSVNYYTYLDKEISSDQYFYRLKWTDQYGQSYYSQTLLIQSAERSSFSISATPDHHIVMLLTAERPQQATISIYDLSGKLMYSENRLLEAGTNHLIITPTQKLVHGLYVVHFKTATRLENAKVIL
jgi:hypothetical protein